MKPWTKRLVALALAGALVAPSLSLAADISNGTNWSETDASNNVASPNGFPEAMAPSGVNDSARTVMGALKRFWDRVNGTLASTGSANAYVLTYTVAPASYATGECFTWRSSFANTTTATLNVRIAGWVFAVS